MPARAQRAAAELQSLERSVQRAHVATYSTCMFCANIQLSVVRVLVQHELYSVFNGGAD